MRRWCSARQRAGRATIVLALAAALALGLECSGLGSAREPPCSSTAIVSKLLAERASSTRRTGAT